MQKSCAADRASKGFYGRAFCLSGTSDPCLVRWSDGDDAALAELVPLVSAPIRSRLDKRFLGIDVG